MDGDVSMMARSVHSISSLSHRWRVLIDKSLPRQELMEIDWAEVPILWQDQMARLAVRDALCTVTLSAADTRHC